jgi:hypothetical protein
MELLKSSGPSPIQPSPLRTQEARRWGTVDRTRWHSSWGLHHDGGAQTSWNRACFAHSYGMLPSLVTTHLKPHRSIIMLARYLAAGPTGPVELRVDQLCSGAGFVE